MLEKEIVYNPSDPEEQRLVDHFNNQVDKDYAKRNEHYIKTNDVSVFVRSSGYCSVSSARENLEKHRKKN